MKTAATRIEGAIARHVLRVEWRVSAPVIVDIRHERGGVGDAPLCKTEYPWESCCGISQEDLVEVN